MSKGLEALAEMEYPGRFIILGRDRADKHDVVVYGMTARSESSQARKLEMRNEVVGGAACKVVHVVETDIKKVQEGNVSLLLYPAIIIGGEASPGIVISNGRQTPSVWDAIRDCGKNVYPPLQVLATGVKDWTYEEDTNSTARISGVIYHGAGLSIIWKDDGDKEQRRGYHEPLLRGEGSFISTYAGPDQNPSPPFKGEPWRLALEYDDPKSLAEAVYKAIGPKDGGKDNRIAVAALFLNPAPNQSGCVIINRHERRESQ